MENYTVESEMLDDQVGYIAVTQFNDNTAQEFEDAIDEVQAMVPRQQLLICVIIRVDF